MRTPTMFVPNVRRQGPAKSREARRRRLVGIHGRDHPRPFTPRIPGGADTAESISEHDRKIVSGPVRGRYGTWRRGLPIWQRVEMRDGRALPVEGLDEETRRPVNDRPGESATPGGRLLVADVLQCSGETNCADPRGCGSPLHASGGLGVRGGARWTGPWAAPGRERRQRLAWHRGSPGVRCNQGAGR